MQCLNHTPFPSISWENVNCNNETFITSLVRVKYKLVKSDIKNKYDLIYHSEQGELFDSDIYYDELGKSSVKYESDFIPYKKSTDIIVNANAICPIKDGSKSWETNVSVFNNDEKVIDYSLLVKSEKIYHKAGIVWTPTLRKNAFNIPIIYEKAFGGIISDNDKEDEHFMYTNEYNPVGCGVKMISDPSEYMHSVQISYPDEKKRTTPAGYGFIEKSWKNRLEYLGTYDDKWLKEQHPLEPKDFDEYYYQAANPNLILNEYINENYKLEFTNLKIDAKKFYFNIPKNDFYSSFSSDINTIYKTMDIDTVIVDINDEDINNHSVYISYRVRVKNNIDIKNSSVMIIDEKIKKGA